MGVMDEGAVTPSSAPAELEQPKPMSSGAPVIRDRTPTSPPTAGPAAHGSTTPRERASPQRALPNTPAAGHAATIIRHHRAPGGPVAGAAVQGATTIRDRRA